MNRGEWGVRAGRGRLLLIFGVVLVVLVGAGAAALALSDPGPAKRVCPSGELCGEPPKLAEPLRNLESYSSSTLGYSVEFSGDRWKAADQDEDSVVLESKEADLLLILDGRPTGAAGINSMIEDRVSSLRKRIFSLERDEDDDAQVLGPNVGYRDGTAQSYAGTIDTPQGARAQLAIVLMGASDGRVGVLATVVTGEQNPERRRAVFGRADSVLNTVTWKDS